MNRSSSRDFSHLALPVEDLRPYYEFAVGKALRVVWRRRLLVCAVTVGVAAAAIGGASTLKKTYVGEAIVQLKFNGDSASQAGPALVTVEGAAVVESEAEIIRSRTIARRVLNRLDRTPPPAAASASPANPGGIDADRRLEELRKKLTVKNDLKTYLIRLSFAAENPFRAAAIANMFAEEYLESRIEISVAAAQRTSEWLDGQITLARAERQRAEDEVRAFRARPEAVAADAGIAQVRDQQMRDLLGQISAAKADGLRLEERLKRLADAAASGRVPSASDLQGSTDIQKLIDAEVAARQEASRQAEVLGTKHPLYLRAEKAHELAQQQIAEAVSAAVGIARMDLASARQTEADLAAQLLSLKAATLNSSMIDRALKTLEAKEAAAQGNIDRLIEAHRQALALADLKQTAAQLVSSAEPNLIPTSPNMTVVAVLGIVGGLVAGLGVVFLLQLRDAGFTTGGEAAAELGAPCGGMIPREGRDENARGRLSRGQALKSLIIAGGLAEPRDGCMVIVVTSTVPGEGKSALVRDLAATLGALDRRVLVVDDTAMGADETIDLDIEDAEPSIDARPLGGRSTASTVTPYHRPSGDLTAILSCHQRFKPWIDDAKMRFDVILVEAPAVLTDVEALRIAHSADLVLFAVRWRSTPKQAAVAAFRQLIPAPGQQAMVVITEVDLREHRKLGARDGIYFARRYADERAPV